MSTALIAQTFRAGIGLRQPHYRDFRVAQSDVRFVEVHSENFLTLMMRRRRCWPSCDRITPSFAWRRSGAGFSLWAGRAAFGQACRARLAYRTCAGVGPCLLRRARHGPHGIVHANDLLPVAFTREQLAIFCAHVQQVQDRLRRPILVENLSSYLDYADCDFREPQFLPSWVCTGCGLLLDVNNLMVNAKMPMSLIPCVPCATGWMLLPVPHRQGRCVRCTLLAVACSLAGSLPRTVEDQGIRRTGDPGMGLLV